MRCLGLFDRCNFTSLTKLVVFVPRFALTYADQFSRLVHVSRNSSIVKIDNYVYKGDVLLTSWRGVFSSNKPPPSLPPSLRCVRVLSWPIFPWRLLGDAYVRRLNYPKCVPESACVRGDLTVAERGGLKGERGNTSCPKQLEGCTSSFGATGVRRGCR